MEGTKKRKEYEQSVTFVHATVIMKPISFALKLNLKTMFPRAHKCLSCAQ